MVGSEPEKVSLLTVRFLLGMIPVTPGHRLLFSDDRENLGSHTVGSGARRILKGENHVYPVMFIIEEEIGPRDQGVFQGYTAN